MRYINVKMIDKYTILKSNAYRQMSHFSTRFVINLLYNIKFTCLRYNGIVLKLLGEGINLYSY